jgi:RNA polymerase sigma-70 factor (ECF subfamily)
METLSKNGARTGRASQQAFLRDIAPFRADLFRFCRSLTNSPWDAEDLVQETLLKIYGRMGDTHAGITNPKSYLFKTAANLWIDWCRRASLPLESEQVPEMPYPMGCSMEVRNALARTLQFLPPRERLAFVLKEVFDFTLEETAEVSQSTVNAVKAALHRARSKMASIPESSIDSERRFTAENKGLIDRLAAAFNKRDLEGMCALFLATATGNGPGCFLENGIEEIKRGSLFHTLNEASGAPQGPSMRAECVVISGELLFVLWLGDVLDDVWRLKFSDGMIAGFDCYYCSPMLLKEIAEILGVTSSHHGYYYEDTAAGKATV